MGDSDFRVTTILNEWKEHTRSSNYQTAYYSASLITTLSSERWTTEALKAPAIGCKVLDSRLELAPGLWSPLVGGSLWRRPAPGTGSWLRPPSTLECDESADFHPKPCYCLPTNNSRLPPTHHHHHHHPSPSRCPKGGPREPCHRAPAQKLLRAAENISGWAVRASEAVTSLKTSWERVRVRERGGGKESGGQNWSRMRRDNEEEEERMGIWAKILVWLQVIWRWHMNYEGAGLTESGSAGVGQVGRGGRWRPDVCRWGRDGARPPALHEPRHRGRSDKRSVNNWWRCSPEKSHRANGWWKTWTLEERKWPVCQNVPPRSWSGSWEGSCFFFSFFAFFFFGFCEDDVATTKTFLDLIWEVLGTGRLK